MATTVTTPLNFKTLKELAQHAMDHTANKYDAAELAEKLLLDDPYFYNSFAPRIAHLAIEAELHLIVRSDRKRSLQHEPELKDPTNDGLKGFDVIKSFPMAAIRHHGFLDYPLFDHTLLGDAMYEKVLKQRNIFRENRIGNQRSETVFTKILKVLKPAPKKSVRECFSFVDVAKLHKEFCPK